MKRTILYSTALLLLIAGLSTCKKYEEGGFVFKRIKNLFGENKDHAKKYWKLKLYEVNGIDSTSLINGAKLYIDSSNESFLKFYISEASAKNYFASSEVYNYDIGISKSAKLLSVGSELNASNNDTTQCFLKNGNLLCQRNIFNPEKNKFAEWQINKLTKSELVITKKLTNSYKIILSQ